MTTARELKRSGSVPKASAERGSRIRVIVRKRPLSQYEKDLGIKDTMVLHTNGSSEAAARGLTLNEPRVKVDLTRYIEQHHFRFDQIFDESSSNQSVYESSAAPLIDRLFKSQFATCFAYGATGAGKTHTMMGTDNEPGIYILAARSIFASLMRPEHNALRLRVASYEIYGGKVFDLLRERKQLCVREDGKKKVNVVGLTLQPISGLADFYELLELASSARVTASTSANADSSRSHAVLQFSLHRGEGRGEKLGPEVGRFSFVDLAGTERGADTLNCADKDRRLEGAEINKSLLALKECIRSLDMGNKHVPFRGSKLTEVLRDSFVGDCHTVMIGAVSPGSDSTEQSLNTLRYATRVGNFTGGGDRAASTTSLIQEPSVPQLGLEAPPSPPPPPPPPPPAARPQAAAARSAIPVPSPRRGDGTSLPSPRGGLAAEGTSSRRLSMIPPPRGTVRARNGGVKTASSAIPAANASYGGQAPGGGEAPGGAIEPRFKLQLSKNTTARTHPGPLLQPSPPSEEPPPSAEPVERVQRSLGEETRREEKRQRVESIAATSTLARASAHESSPRRTSARAPHKGATVQEKENGSSQRTASSLAARQTETAPAPSEAEMLRSLLTAHRQFIASSVEQLDTHTYLLTQADSGASAMSTYAGAVKALLTERDATVEALKTAVRAAAAKS